MMTTDAEEGSGWEPAATACGLLLLVALMLATLPIGLRILRWL